ncbi:MAG: beta-ribofuranosylaminobenzene 5'-phosphate synthase [Euryarchaeota archaeon]|nr:beta-ribofuranosylaminobenzene 5'-phosphate synthase [Euryarchaeota archaeon]
MLVTIKTPSRLHISLIDLHGKLGRIDGGIGVALEFPSVSITAEKAKKLIVSQNELKESAESAAKKMLNYLNIKDGVKITFNESYSMHIGLGSITQTSLAVAQAIAKLYGIKLSVLELAKIVERGGTSGIGVAAFEGGSFILDGGHKFGVEKKEFAPSDATHGVPPPPVILRHNFPDWNIVLAIPNVERGAYGQKEVNIFKQYCPIPLSEVQAVSHLILIKMLPALVERDINTFGQSINEIQSIGFKKIELELQHPIIKKLMETMIKAGACGAGMSSFGPLVYGIADKDTTRIQQAAQELLDRTIHGKTLITKANNTGARILIWD